MCMFDQSKVEEKWSIGAKWGLILSGFCGLWGFASERNILKNKSGVVGIKWGSSFLGFAVSEVLVLKKENFFSALILITTKPSSVF